MEQLALDYDYTAASQQLTEQQRADFNDAAKLAVKANEAFDVRRHEAKQLVKYLGESVSPYSIKDAFLQADSNFELYNKAADELMPPLEAFQPTETPEDIEKEDSKRFISESIWNFMSPEQKVKAARIRSAMSEQLAEHGGTFESLRVVMTESEEGNKSFTVVHTGNGIDIGDHSEAYDEARSYNSVMDKKNDALFKIQVEGKSYDTRKGMTAPVYDALYQDSLNRDTRDVPLPDSKQASKEYDDVWTWTMLTGEPLTADGGVQIRYVLDGEVCGVVGHPGGDYRSLRVRPAVEVE